MNEGLGAMFASGVVEGGAQLDPRYPLLFKHTGQSQDFRCVSVGSRDTMPLRFGEVVHLYAGHDDAVVSHAHFDQNRSPRRELQGRGNCTGMHAPQVVPIGLPIRQCDTDSFSIYAGEPWSPSTRAS